MDYENKYIEYVKEYIRIQVPTSSCSRDSEAMHSSCNYYARSTMSAFHLMTQVDDTSIV